MTIGPDPRTRTLWISVRLGIGGVPVTRSADGSMGPGDPPLPCLDRSAQAGGEVPQPLQPLLQRGPRRSEGQPEVPRRPERLPRHRRHEEILEQSLGDVVRRAELLALPALAD